MPRHRTTHRTSPPGTTQFSKLLRQKITPAEKLLWSHLRSRKVTGAKFRRQHPIGLYIADFFCPEAALIIELDGVIHDSEEQRKHDVIRDHALRNHGLKVMRFSNKDVTDDIGSVLAQIKRTIEVELGD